VNTNFSDWQITLNYVNDMVMVLDRDCKILQANESVLNFLKKPLSEVIGRTCHQLFHGTAMPISACPMTKMKETTRREQADLYIEEKDIWVSVTVDPMLDESGNVEGSIHIIRDITARKNMEETLRHERKQFRELFDHMSSGVAVYEARDNGEDFIIKDVNSAAERSSKVVREEIAGKSVLQVFPGVREIGLFDVFQQVFKTGKPRSHPVSLYRDKRIFQWVENYVYKLPSGQIVAIYDDVTERKQAEENLKNSEAILKGVVTAVPVGLGMASNRVIEWVNDYLPAMVGYQKEEIIGKNSRIFYEDEEGYTDVGNRFYADLRAKGSAEMETVWKRKDGRLLNIYLTGIALDREEAPSKIIFCALDITVRKQSEEALVFSNTILNTQQEASIDGILVVNEKGEILSFNRRFVKMWGISPGVIESRSDERALQSVTDKLTDPEEFIIKVKHLYEARNKTSRDEVSLKDGRVFDRYSAPMIDPEGKYYGRVWYFRDITERKQADKTLRDNEERFRDITYNMADWVWEVDEKGVYTYSSYKGPDLLGRSIKEIIGKTPFDFMAPEEAKRVAGAFSKILENKAPIKDLENWIIRKDGERICLLTNGVPMLDNYGNFKGYRGVDKNITERKRSEEVLQKSENRYHALFESSRDAIMTIEPPLWNFTSGNPATIRMFMVKDEEDFISRAPWTLSPESQPDGRASDQKAQEMIGIAMRDGSNFFEWTHKRLNGEEFLATVLLTRMTLGEKDMLQATIRDITEHKNVEEESRKRMQELEIFYKASVGREERIIELKKELELLKKRLNEKK
jgi:two-component system sensor histidine kinase/response regulator